MTRLAFALVLLLATGCAPARAEPSAAASAAAHVHAMPTTGIPAPRLSVEDLRRLTTVLRDERANRRAFGR